MRAPRLPPNQRPKRQPPNRRRRRTPKLLPPKTNRGKNSSRNISSSPVIRLVLFDIDGTLIRSGGAGEKAFARVFETEFNVPNGTARLPFAGRTDPSIVRDFFRQHHIEPGRENFRRFFDSYAFWLDHLLGQIAGRVLPGVPEMIRDWQALPRPPAIGLLTGNIRLGAQIKLNYYRLWHLFQTGAFGDDHEDRSQIAAIARERGSHWLNEKLRGDQILVIGDTPLDRKF
ncbi:MAG: hydrolase [Verrucomicrobia bacterium]|nr:MAG: hydrolase [Verrucomicrobiota bacterium]